MPTDKAGRRKRQMMGQDLPSQTLQHSRDWAASAPGEGGGGPAPAPFHSGGPWSHAQEDQPWQPAHPGPPLKVPTWNQGVARSRSCKEKVEVKQRASCQERRWPGGMGQSRCEGSIHKDGLSKPQSTLKPWGKVGKTSGAASLFQGENSSSHPPREEAWQGIRTQNS